MVAYLDQGGAQHLVKKILDRIQPVGSLYYSTNNTSPASLFGGSWERYAQGRVMVSASDTDTDFSVGKTGGSKTHTILQTELPFHTHDLSARINGDTDVTTADFVMNVWTYPGQYHNSNGWHHRFAHTVSNDANAGATRYPNNPMPILSPYISVYIWRRTA